MGLQLRKDTDALRQTLTLRIGEPFYTTDTKRFFIGDGATAGGTQMGSITSLALAMPSAFVVTGSPVTLNGTIVVSYGLGQIPPANLGTGSAVATNFLNGTGVFTPLVNSLTVGQAGGTARTGALRLIGSSSVTITEVLDGTNVIGFQFTSAGGGGGGGTGWTSVGNLAINDIAFGFSANGQTIAPGSTYSFDGSNILFNDFSYRAQIIPFINSSSTPSPIVFGNNLFLGIALFNGANFVVTAGADALVWTLRSLGFSGNFFQAFGIYGESFLIFNETNIARSTDGISWTQLSGVTAGVSTAAYSGSLYVALGNGSSTARTSTNGTTWTAQTGPSFTLPKIAFGGSTFVIIDGGSTNSATTTNGVSYTTRSNLPATGFFQIVSSGTIFLAASDTQLIVSSNAGVTFTTVTLPSPITLNIRIIYAGDRFALIGRASSATNFFYTSTSLNGTTWTTPALIPALFNVATTPTLAYGNGVMVINAANIVNQRGQDLILSFSTNHLYLTDSENTALYKAPVGSYRLLGGSTSVAEEGLWVRTA